MAQAALRRKTKTISLRLDESVEAGLRQSSSEKGLTLNSLANQVLERYVSWGRYAEKLGVIPVNKEFLRRVLDFLTDEQAEKVGRELGSFLPRESISVLSGRFDPEAMIEFLKLWLSRFQGFQFRSNGRQHKFTAVHDINLRYSILLGAFIEAAVKDFLKKDVRVELTPNSISFAVS